jgi:hypothetical protein
MLASEAHWVHAGCILDEAPPLADLWDLVGDSGNGSQP